MTGPNLLWLIILFVSVRDTVAVPHLIEREGEGWLGGDSLWNAGAAAAAFASGAKIPEFLNNLKEFVMPSPQPDQTADPATAPETNPVEPDQPVKGQDLDSTPPGQSLPGEILPDTTGKLDRPVDIELSVQEAPFDPSTKGDECTATFQLANPDPTVGSQSLLTLFISDIEFCSNQPLAALAMVPRVRSFIHLIANALS